LDAGADVDPDRHLALDVRAGSDPRRRVFRISARMSIREGILRWMSVGED
jgi:hypothetical protein